MDSFEAITQFLECDQSVIVKIKLFKKDFKFVGGEIINEFLMSAGYLKGAHDETCNIFNVVLLSDPNWKKCENR